jgi:hypothetical protein
VWIVLRAAVLYLNCSGDPEGFDVRLDSLLQLMTAEEHEIGRVLAYAASLAELERAGGVDRVLQVGVFLH